jgi:ABC-type multidrug transport system ATPase subunit
MIVCENMTKLFDGNSGIRNVNLQFSPGRIYGIIGYNGSGKTTLLRCLEGLYAPTSGCIYHNDIKTTEDRLFLPYRRKISFLPADDYLYQKLTCMDNIELATILRTGKNKLLKETEDLIKYFEVKDFLHKKFKDCSTGTKKKIQLIASLTGEIETIIWDEPNDGLDMISNVKIKNLLKYYRSRNATLIFSCHVIEFLENFIDHCVLLKDGYVAENTSADNIKSLHELYSSNVDGDGLTFPPASGNYPPPGCSKPWPAT